MFLISRPSPKLIRKFLEEQAGKSFSYSEIGATNSQLPPGYSINHTRKQVGFGTEVFEASCAALRTWQHLQLGWVDCWPHDAPLQAGSQIAVLGKALGFWSLNACRIAYTIDERGEGAKFGYAHGTLPAHIATGEERFLVEMATDGQVFLDILAFSRPNTLLAKIGYPFMKRAQKRFGRESARCFLECVKNAAAQNIPSSQSVEPALQLEAGEPQNSH